MEKYKPSIYIGVNIDWSKSFVDKNGAFYCQTTDEQKRLAASLMPHMDLVIYATDFHSITSKEFLINNGMWPLHNVAEYKKIDVTKFGLEKGTTISPKQTKTIDQVINKAKSGMIVPKHVYFQDSDKVSFTPKDVEEAFGEKIITPDEFLKHNYTYIISPKIFFDATDIIGDYSLPTTNLKGIPEQDYTVFNLIQKKYPSDNYNLVFVNTGVVENICRHYTSKGERQKFPDARIINPIGATTELAGVGLGFEDKQQVRDACMRISKDIGIEYMPVEQVIQEIAKR